jgi:hypothetical protein
LIQLTSVKSSGQAVAAFVCDVELLVCDQKLGAGQLTRPDVGVRVVAFSSEPESVLVGKLPDAFQTGPAVDWHVVLREHCLQLLVRVQALANSIGSGLHAGWHGSTGAFRKNCVKTLI